jgi:hypothetical protein
MSNPSCPNTWVLLCGVDHRQHEGWCAIIHFCQEVRMSDSESDRKRELECPRLASDLIQLATETLNPDLKAKTKARLRTKKPLCVRYAEVMRLRQAIIEAQSAKPAREGRLAPK